MDGKKQKQKRRAVRKKPNWSRRRSDRPKKKWMPPQAGRPKYDKFRANEIMDVANEIRMFVERERVHEKQPGGSGHSPAKKRDIIKCVRDFVPVTEG